MPDAEVELLRSVLVRAYEKQQPLSFRLVQAIKDSIGLRIRRKRVSLTLSNAEKIGLGTNDPVSNLSLTRCEPTCETIG